MAGPSQSDLECMKILLPRLYAETLVSARFLCAESDLLGFAFGNELVPLSGYVDRCAHRNYRLQWPEPSELTKNSSFVWMMSQLVVLLVHTYLYCELIVGFYGLVGWPLIVAITVFHCSSTCSDLDRLYFLGSDYLRL